MYLLKNKYFISAVIGFFLKLYDDLDELFFYKNERVMECIKTFYTIINCYYLLYLSNNKYDILWFLFFWGFLPLVDWYAFTGTPYFFSLVLLISLTCLCLIFFNGYSYRISYFVFVFLLYCICSPISEIYCWEFNGPVFELFKKLNIIDDKKPNIFSGLSKTEIEVSKTKIFTRIRSIIFLIIIIGILYYFINNTNDIEIKELLSSVIQFSIFNISYFILSIINQCYIVYFDNTFIEIHKKINKEEKNAEEKNAEEKNAEEKNK